tara:strand:+ start:342 stop:599 length:258 start_codon:yes stop_codon:yes gene_type:complete
MTKTKTKTGIHPLSFDRTGTINLMRINCPAGMWDGIDREASIAILETQPEGSIAIGLKYLVPNGEPLAKWIVQSLKRSQQEKENK